MNIIGTKGILIICTCTFTIAGLFFISKNDYNHIKINNNQTVTKETTDNKTVNTPASLSNNDQISKLFGQSIDALPEASPQKELPETRLKLTLKGTFTHKDSDKASALIAENSKSTARFFVGDEIPGGAELIAVRKGEITLRRNGQDELLKLPYLKTDERITQNSRRHTPSSKQTSSISTNSQTEYNSKSNKSLTTVANNSHQQQLKDRLAKLRNNRSRSTSSPH